MLEWPPLSSLFRSCVFFFTSFFSRRARTSGDAASSRRCPHETLRPFLHPSTNHTPAASSPARVEVKAHPSVAVEKKKNGPAPEKRKKKASKMIDVSSSKPLLAVAGICTWTAVLISIHQVGSGGLVFVSPERGLKAGGSRERGRDRKTLEEKLMVSFFFDASRQTLHQPTPTSKEKKNDRSSSTSGTTRSRSSSGTSSASSSWSPSTP